MEDKKIVVVFFRQIIPVVMLPKPTNKIIGVFLGIIFITGFITNFVTLSSILLAITGPEPTLIETTEVIKELDNRSEVMEYNDQLLIELFDSEGNLKDIRTNNLLVN